MRAVELGRDASGRDDVEQRIPVRELMEMHLVDRNAMDLRLRVGQEREQRQRVFARR